MKRILMLAVTGVLLSCSARPSDSKLTPEQIHELALAEKESENLALKMSILEMQYQKYKSEKETIDAKILFLKKLRDPAPPPAEKK